MLVGVLADESWQLGKSLPGWSLAARAETQVALRDWVAIVDVVYVPMLNLVVWDLDIEIGVEDMKEIYFKWEKLEPI